MNSHDHPVFMHRCLELARLGSGHVAPNPMVGSVLVHNGVVIGEGYHAMYGQAHAEVNCIADAIANCKNAGLDDAAIGRIFEASTIYVSLEPCAHFGKTPPCADLVISKEIPSVIVGCRDPFPLVDGKGIEKLQQAGIKVTLGVMEEECKALNRYFFTFHSRMRPYIILKWAQSADGKIAAHVDARTMISNEAANRLVHRWRSESSSIFVGTNTALADDPSLTTRLWTGRNPLRLVVDMKLRLPQTLRLFNGEAHTIVFNAIKEEEVTGISYCKTDPSRSLARQVSETLYRKQVTSVLVEGGQVLLQHFIDEGLWDEVRVITNENLFIGEGTDAPALRQASLVRHENVGSDKIHYYQPIHS